MSNEFDAAVAASLQPDPAQSARVGFSVASDTNPDAYAEAQRVARRTGVPVDTVFAMPAEIKRQDAIGSIDFDSLAKTSPATAALLADIDKAKLAHDDVENMSGIESALSFLGGSTLAGLNDLAGAGAKLVDSLNPFTLSDQDAAVLYKGQPEKLAQMRAQSPAMALSRFARGRTEASKQNMLDISPGAQATYGDLKYATTDPINAAYLSPVKLIGDAVRSLPTTAALALTTYLTRGAAIQAEKQALTAGATAEVAREAGIAAATNMAVKFGAASEGSIGYAQQALQTQNDIESMPLDTIGKSPEFLDLVNKGYDPNAARIFLAARAGEQAGVGAGFADAITNAIGGKFLGKIIGEGGGLLPRIGKGVVNEGVVEGVQSPFEQWFQNAATQANTDPSKDLSGGLLESTLQGLFVGGLTGGAFAGAMGRAHQKEQQAQQTDQTAQLLTGLNKLAEASKLRGRDVETAQGFFQSALAEGRDALYITPEALAQSGLAEKLAATIPDVQEQLQTAAESGHDIRIPIADLMTRMAGPELEQALIPHLAVEPGGFTPTTAQEYLQSGKAQELQTEVERVLAEQDGSESFKASASVVTENIKSQLDTAARFSPQVNDAYATMVGNFYAVQAARVGTTPEEMFTRYPLKIGAEPVVGQQFDQPAFHGSPYHFDKFSLDHMGKGEGNQAFGWGLYFAGDKAIAQHYRDNLGAGAFEYDGVPVTGESAKRSAIELLWSWQGDKQGAIDDADGYENPKAIKAEIKKLDYAKIKQGGQLYKVDIPVDDTMLLWDAPLSEQPEAVQKALARLDKNKYSGSGSEYAPEITGREIYQGLWESLIKSGKAMPAKDKQRQASEKLNSLGVRGIKYLDSNGRPDGSGSHNYVIFDDSAVKILDRYYQDARGAFNPASLSITLLKKADLSTVLHESGHFFLEVMADIAAQPNAPAQVQQDMAALLGWFGIRSMDEWHNLDFEERRSYHERFARGFEAYLFEGKAPSIEMQGLFQRFRAWLLNVYRDLKALNVEITDEVRGVFDRMLATTEQIKLAEQGRSMMPLFTSPEQAGMTPEEFADYQALGVDATNEASQELQSRGLRDMRWLHSARGRIIKQLQREAKEKRAEVRAGVRGEAMSQPVYRAWGYLTGKDKGGPDGAVADGDSARWMAHGKLSISDLGAIGLPVEMIGHLKALRMTAKDGLHPDLIAEKFGFGSGDELVRTLLASTPPREEIEALTDRRMLEQYGDLSSPEAIERAADKAIHNEVRARFVATEANALAKATGQRQILASAAKGYAAAMIARLKVRNIKPGQYASAEARAAKVAEKASKAGDLQTAAAEKRNQLINNYATRAAYDAQEEVEAIRRKWAELANRADDKLRKSYDIDLINAVRAILGQYGIAEKKAQRAVEYLAKVETYDPEMFGVVRTSVDAAEANAKPWRELTVEEVRGLAGELDAITHLARRSKQMEIDGDLMDREEIEAALRVRLDEIGVPESVPGDDSAITSGEARMLQFKTALASMRRVESWVGKMDGAEAMGPFRRFVWNRIKDSADAYRADKARYLRQFRDLFDAIAPTMKPGLIAAPELGYTFGKDSGGAAMNEIVHAVLHTGNESNKRKLLLGRRWAVERVDGSLDTSRWDAFVARMVQEGKIKQEHYDFAQGVWDLLESTKPLAQKTHRDVFGKYFDEITAQPFTDPFGVARAGGYAPAMADSRVVTDAKLRALSEAENAGMAYAFPTTPKGFTKSRVEYNRPLMLDLRTLAQHIDKVLLFSHMEMPVRDVQRVISRIGGTLDRVDPAAISGMLAPWLTRSARQQVMTPIAADAGMSRFLATLRARAGAAAMFGNVANAVQQVTGFSLAAVKVPPRLLLSSTVDYVKSPRKFAAAVSEASPYMADRLESEVSAMNDDINAILLNPSVMDKAQAWTMRHAYFLQTAIDSVMSPIVWTAAYNQALEQGLEHRDAVRLGDSAVRETQGSTLPEDIARIESGNAFVRLFTQFAGYFNMQANLLGSEFGKLAQDLGLLKSAPRGLYVLMFGFLAPAVVGELVMQAFRGGPPDDDKDGEYLDDWLAALFGWAPLRTATAMVPVVGSAANATINAWNSKPYDDRMATSPAISMLESAARAPVSAYKAIKGDGSAQKAVRDVATLISVTVGLPANLAARPVGYLAGMADDEIIPTGPIDAVRGAVTGTSSPQSKR